MEFYMANNSSDKYVAFISYRHTPNDIRTAEKIHRMIESYRIPRGAASDGRRRIGRVFRDKDELAISSSLSDKITNALDNSEYLIVICSSATPESEWCNREIKYFISKHDREHVLAILIDGTPETSFPKPLVEVYGDDGVTVIKREEPLAAYAVGKNHMPDFSALKKDSLRIFATLIGCSYDNLVKREKKRHKRNIISIATLVSLIAIAYIATISYKNLQIQQKNKELLRESSKAYTLLANSDYDNHRRYDSIRAALNALPYENTDMPYNADAEKILTRSLGYYQNNEFTDLYSISHNAYIQKAVVSEIDHQIAVYDSENEITCYDTETGIGLWNIQLDKLFPSNIDKIMYSESANGIICSNKNVMTETGGLNSVVMLDGSNGKPKWRIPGVLLNISNDGKYAAIYSYEYSWNSIIIVDVETGSEPFCYQFDALKNINIIDAIFPNNSPDLMLHVAANDSYINKIIYINTKNNEAITIEKNIPKNSLVAYSQTSSDELFSFIVNDIDNEHLVNISKYDQNGLKKEENKIIIPNILQDYDTFNFISSGDYFLLHDENSIILISSISLDSVFESTYSTEKIIKVNYCNEGAGIQIVLNTGDVDYIDINSIQKKRIYRINTNINDAIVTGSDTFDTYILESNHPDQISKFKVWSGCQNAKECITMPGRYYETEDGKQTLLVNGNNYKYTCDGKEVGIYHIPDPDLLYTYSDVDYTSDGNGRQIVMIIDNNTDKKETCDESAISPKLNNILRKHPFLGFSKNMDCLYFYGMIYLIKDDTWKIVDPDNDYLQDDPLGSAFEERIDVFSTDNDMLVEKNESVHGQMSELQTDGSMLTVSRKEQSSSLFSSTEFGIIWSYDGENWKSPGITPFYSPMSEFGPIRIGKNGLILFSELTVDVEEETEKKITPIVLNVLDTDTNSWTTFQLNKDYDKKLFPKGISFGTSDISKEVYFIDQSKRLYIYDLDNSDKNSKYKPREIDIPTTNINWIKSCNNDEVLLLCTNHGNLFAIDRKKDYKTINLNVSTDIDNPKIWVMDDGSTILLGDELSSEHSAILFNLPNFEVKAEIPFFDDYITSSNKIISYNEQSCIFDRITLQGLMTLANETGKLYQSDNNRLALSIVDDNYIDISLETAQKEIVDASSSTDRLKQDIDGLVNDTSDYSLSITGLSFDDKNSKGEISFTAENKSSTKTCNFDFELYINDERAIDSYSSKNLGQEESISGTIEFDESYKALSIADIDSIRLYISVRVNSDDFEDDIYESFKVEVYPDFNVSKTEIISDDYQSREQHKEDIKIIDNDYVQIYAGTDYNDLFGYFTIYTYCQNKSDEYLTVEFYDFYIDGKKLESSMVTEKVEFGYVTVDEFSYSDRLGEPWFFDLAPNSFDNPYHFLGSDANNPTDVSTISFGYTVYDENGDEIIDDTVSIDNYK